MAEEGGTPFCGNSPLWNETLLLNGTWPELTECFQATVLVYVPAAWLWLSLPPYLLYLCFSSPGIPLPLSPLCIAKTTLCFLLALLMVVVILGENALEEGNKQLSTAHYVARFLEGASYLVAGILVQLERARGMITSGVLFVYWLMLVVVDLVPLFSYILLRTYEGEVYRFATFMVSYPLIVIQLILHSFAETRIPRNREQEYTKEQCPEIKASFLSQITFAWMTSLIYKGWKKPLEEGDLWELNPRDKCQRVVPQLEEAWNKEVNRCKLQNEIRRLKHVSMNDHVESAETLPLLSESLRSKNGVLASSLGGASRPQEKQPSLYKVMVKTYYLETFLSYLCKLVSDVLQFMSPLLLRAFIGHIQGGGEPAWQGYVIAVGFCVLAWVQSSFYHRQFHLAMTLGMRMKVALMAAVYKKALRLNSEAMRESTVGEIVNLMAVDCQRIQDLMSYSYMVWSIPFQVVLAVYLLWDAMGPAVLAGLGVLIVLVPINAFLAMKQQKLQRANLKHKDHRVKVINEVLNGIKVLKLYAWELSFRDKILSIRNREQRVLMSVAYLTAVCIFIWTCAPYLITLATFVTYAFTSEDGRLDAQKAFVTLSLFNILQFPINFIPQTINYIAQARVSVVRLNKFLTNGELDPQAVQRDDLTGSAVSIHKGTFRWDQITRPALSGINIDVSEGELVAVVGSVGAGKSSLLSAVLGEMERVHGRVSLKGRVAYVPQQAWIKNATVRDNILFGSDFIRRRYDKVLDACALRQDLKILPGGDMTEIGEKGINLSGGQKQRVSLARAVYSDADVFLLDDPLSAVDSHVGKHIFRKVISDKGMLRSKTRIFVTHAVHWLPLVDTILVMNDGRITEAGNYVRLMKHNGPFAQFLLQHFTQAEDMDGEDDPEIQDMKRKMWEHVGHVTSTSEATSGDESAVFKRLTSRNSVTSEDGSRPATSGGNGNDGNEKAGSKLTDEEKSVTGKVSLGVFGAYLRAVGFLATVFIVATFAVYQGCNMAANIWLAAWTEDAVLNNVTDVTAAPYFHSNEFYLTIYGVFGIGQGLFVLMYAYVAATRMVEASQTLHHDMLDTVLRAPMSFFETTPIGRIVNRFSRDVETIDNNLPQVLFMWVTTIFSVISTIIVISIATPYFLIVVIPLFALYTAIQRFFVASSRQMKRLEAVTRSPIFSHFAESVSGAASIRAYGVQQRFVAESQTQMDKNLVFYFAGITANRWLGIWIEFISSIIVFFAALFSIVSPDVNGGQAGLSVTYALQITQSLKWLVRTLSDLETYVVSVERVKEYAELPIEAAWEIPERKPAVSWPSRGDVSFHDYETRYRPGLDLVLKGISCQIRGGEKIGIVGRTGAGKSSLTLSLFRIIEAAGGEIVIDDIRISILGLHDLRSKLTILPQDPVIFSGTLRMNLDPFEQFSEQALWHALGQAHLKSFVESLPARLDHECGEGGQALSVGQRQLVCLARALLRKTRVLILDEATAAVDMETDVLIQGTIRTEFHDCTILTIAHRLNTILDYDRILVLDDGKIREFDSPDLLLADENSLFHSLAKDAGIL